MSDQLTDELQTAALDVLRSTIASLRESWGWLGELVEPGWETTPAPILSDAQRARIGKAVREERSQRAGTKARGLGPLTERRTDIGVGALASAPAGARLAVIDAAVAVRFHVVEAARLAAHAVGSVYVGQGAGDAAVHDALSYLDGAPCWIASTTGVIGRRTAGAAIDSLHLEAINTVSARLSRADRLARTAAGVAGDYTLTFPHPCPACGKRSLQWQIPGADRRLWSVQCIRPQCTCTGQGCPCRHAVRYEGRRHAWSHGELDGTWGLWRAIAAARRANPRIRSGVAGHGGWPERR